MDNENTTPAEEKDKKPEAEKPAENAEEPKAETAPKTPSGATEEQGEETTPENTEKAAESKPEQPEETQEESADPAAELEALRAENTRRRQLQRSTPSGSIPPMKKARAVSRSELRLRKKTTLRKMPASTRHSASAARSKKGLILCLTLSTTLPSSRLS